MALEIKHENLFKQIVSDAIQTAIETCSTEKLAARWERAIDRAVAEIQTNPFLDFDTETNQLLILSSSSNNIYSANGICQCLAFLNGTPCWHRAAARIWRLYTEAENKPLPPAKGMAAAGGEKFPTHFLKLTSNRKPEKIGGVRI